MHHKINVRHYKKMEIEIQIRYITINIHDIASMHSTGMREQNDNNQTNGPSTTTMHVVAKMCWGSSESVSIQQDKTSSKLIRQVTVVSYSRNHFNH
jgi:hypothetical protein